MSTDAVYSAFQGQLDSTNAITLLLAAEAAGRASDPSVAAHAAAAAVAAAVGFPLGNYDSLMQQKLIGCVLTKLHSLQYLCQGPSQAVPSGNYYSWSYP
jgi:hypothetical protein